MASNIQGGLVQGALDEGQPAANERPVLVAGKDTVTGLITDLPITGTTVPISGTVTATVPNPLPVNGTVTANQGTQNAGGAAAWPVQGPQAAAAAIAQNPFVVAGELAGNVKLLHLTTLGSPVADQGLQGSGGTASWQVQGAAAAGAAVAGNPVRVGINDGTNTQDWKQVAATGSNQAATGIAAVGVQLFNGASYNPQGSMSAAGDATAVAGIAAVGTYDWNGANADRHRNNVDVTLLASASRTTTQTSADITTYNLQAITVILDATVIGTGSVTVSIDGKDPASGKYYNLLTGAAIVGNGTNVYFVDPVIPAVANVNAQRRLPRVIRIVVTANNPNPVTYSVGYTQHSPGG